MAVAICESAGWDVNSIPRWHEPVSVVVRELFAASKVRSFPGSPVKLLACFAMTDHVNVTGAHGTRALTDTEVEAPGGVARSRSCTVLPTSVAVPTDGAPTERGVNPAGNVRFADPSCWVPVSLVRVAVNVVVAPAGTAAGAITTAYGFFELAASAGTTNSVSRTTGGERRGDEPPGRTRPRHRTSCWKGHGTKSVELSSCFARSQFPIRGKVTSGRMRRCRSRSWIIRSPPTS